MLRFCCFFFLVALLLPACQPRPTLASNVVSLPDPTEPFIYEPYRVEGVSRPATYDFTTAKTSLDPADYAPDATNERYLPMRYLRVNFHVMNTTDTLYRFYGDSAIKSVREVLEYTNYLFNSTPELWLKPDSMDVPALPRRLRVVLASRPGTDGVPAIYEHYDDALYWYLHKGKKRNRSDRAVIDKYAIRKDSELNIFIMGPPRDSLVSKHYRLPGTDGIYLGDAIKMTGWLENDREPWELRGILAHEIGHALTLNHAWANDGCDDTPNHKNDYWQRAPEDTGPGKTSNNLMDYSNEQQALTPCQIGRMHAALHNINGKQRKWLLPDWCDYNPDLPVRITSDVVWNGARDFNTDIFVRRGKTLRINGRLHLPEDAKIYVDPGAVLIFGSQAVVHSDCGGEWGGIRVGVHESGYQGEVMVEEGAVLLNEQE